MSSELALPETSLRFPPSVQRRLDYAMASFERGSGLPDPDDVRDPRAAGFARHARSDSTKDKYKYFLALYLGWCEQIGRRDIPATAATLEAFAIYLASWRVKRGKNKGLIGMAPNSIKLALAAVRTYHRVQGVNPPDLGLAHDMLAGHARSRAAANVKDDKGSPGLRLPTLYEMADALDLDTLSGQHDLALLSAGWATMGRRSELARVGKVDVTREGDLGIKIYISRSKTDQLGKGRTILVPYRPDLGVLCAATNMLRWNGILEDHGVFETGGFFRGIDKHEHINGLPGYGGFRNSEWMHPTTVERTVRSVAQRALVRNFEDLTAHSLRRGGATDLYLAGVDILTIARQGGWGERSPIIFRYIEDIEDWERNALAVANFGALLRQAGRV